MKVKLFILLFICVSFFIILSSLVFAEITTIKSETVKYPDEEMKLVIMPTNSGFYNIIYVYKDTEIVDLINVNCNTVCTKKRRVYYTVPADFLGEYYFATYDYAIEDYELDYFSVIKSGGAPSGELIVEHIQNSESGVNGIINPEQGKNANISILTRLRIKECSQYTVQGYLCNSTVPECNAQDYTYQLPLTLKSVSTNGRRCYWEYIGEDYFPFYQAGDNWKLYVESGILKNIADFTYTTLAALNYPAEIDFGTLNAQLWNIGVPDNGVEMINHGNLPLTLEWTCSGFDCVSPECTDYWSTFYLGENTFQIDDDKLFLELPEDETGLNPVFITDYSLDYFPETGLAVCISSACNDNLGEKTMTYYNLKIPDIQKGKYHGDILVTMS